jgi:hypothetical protein
MVWFLHHKADPSGAFALAAKNSLADCNGIGIRLHRFCRSKNSSGNKKMLPLSI